MFAGTEIDNIGVIGRWHIDFRAMRKEVKGLGIATIEDDGNWARFGQGEVDFATGNGGSNADGTREHLGLLEIAGYGDCHIGSTRKIETGEPSPFGFTVEHVGPAAAFGAIDFLADACGPDGDFHAVGRNIVKGKGLLCQRKRPSYNFIHAPSVSKSTCKIHPIFPIKGQAFSY